MVSVTGGGESAVMLPIRTVADTVTSWSGSSRVSPAAATVTVPVLVVAFAAITSVRAVLTVKSPASAFVPGVAETVTVTGVPSAGLSNAVTVATPPVSEIDEDDNESTVSDVVPSSSRMVIVASAGLATPWPPAAVPETVTDLFGVSAVLPTATMVTVPVLVVAPAATVNVVPVCVKSEVIAFAPGAAETVTVTASPDFPLRLAVTVATPPVSGIDDGSTASDTVGSVSSSDSVRAAPVTVTVCELAAAWSLAAVPVTVVERPATPS